MSGPTALCSAQRTCMVEHREGVQVDAHITADFLVVPALNVRVPEREFGPVGCGEHRETWHNIALALIIALSWVEVNELAERKVNGGIPNLHSMCLAHIFCSEGRSAPECKQLPVIKGIIVTNIKANSRVDTGRRGYAQCLGPARRLGVALNIS